MVIKQKQPSMGEAEAGLIGKGVLKICNKFTGENPNRSAISIKLLCNFIEIALRHRRYPVNLQHFSEHLFIGKPVEGYF